VSIVEDNESESTSGKEETWSQSFQNVLSIHTVRHEGNRPGNASFINSTANTRRLDNDIVDDSSCDQEIGE